MKVAILLSLALAGCVTTETREHLAVRHACEVEALGANASIYLQARLYKDCMQLQGAKP